MSGETQSQESGWTTDTLKYHADQQFTALSERVEDMRTMLDERYATQTKAVDAAFLAQQTAMRTALEAAERAVATAMTAAEKAVVKQEFASEKRFEAVNEFRGQLADQATKFVSKDEFSQLQKRVDERIESLQKMSDRHEGRDSGISAGWAYLVGFASIVAVFVGVLGYLH